MNWKLAARAEKMNPSVIREILKVTEKPGIISRAGGLPWPVGPAQVLITTGSQQELDLAA